MEGSGGGSFDPEVLYQTSTEWIALGKNIDVLQHQLDQAKKDIDQLMKLRSDGIENPEAFLADFRSGKLKFPKLQSIARVPDLDLSKYSRKTSRRGNSKYEQNLEFLLSMANELHRRTAAVPPVLLSSSIQISGTSSLPAQDVTSQIRDKFFDITGGPPIRPVSAPAPAYSGTETPFSSGRVTPMPMESDSSLNLSAEGIPVPQPRTQRFARVSMADENVATHYNLPWSDEEKRRLEELLIIYPEESVSARRYAKIAEALGTRTASQVSNRIHKLNAKRAKSIRREAEASRDQASRLLKKIGALDVAAGSGEDDLNLLDIDDDMKNSEEYQEYMRLKQHLDDIKAHVVEHVGFRCDGCGMDPIIGIRYHCDTCMEEFDLCQTCINLNTKHDSTHSFSKVTTAIQQQAK